MCRNQYYLTILELVEYDGNIIILSKVQSLNKRITKVKNWILYILWRNIYLSHRFFNVNNNFKYRSGIVFSIH